MEHVEKPNRKTLYYVLLTRCAHCAYLIENGTRVFKPRNRNAQYVIGIVKRVIIHPVTRAVTHNPGDRITIGEGTAYTVFKCPHHGNLGFVFNLSFGNDCTYFSPKLLAKCQTVIHHRMPDGKEVRCNE